MQNLERKEADQPSVRIVLVNDSAFMLDPLFRLLERKGVAVVRTYGNGVAVKNDVESSSFPDVDAILTEVDLSISADSLSGPQNAIELVKYFKQNGIEKPIIAFSTFRLCTEGDLSHLQSLGVIVDTSRFRIGSLSGATLASSIRQVVEESKSAGV